MIGKEFKVLDRGHVILDGYMGDDRLIDRMARGSYTSDGEERTPAQIRGLNRYLVRHKHTTPFEHVKLRFHVKVPIFVWRQWARHRMASISEKSGRYTTMEEWCEILPSDMRMQHESSKQCSTEETIACPEYSATELNNECMRSHAAYLDAVEDGVSKEQARVVLPLSTYTEAYWSTDLHNLMHFLHLRLASNSQYQIREYARAIARIVEELFPVTWESFCDFRLFATSFSESDMAFIARHIQIDKLQHEVARSFPGGPSEKKELISKISKFDSGLDREALKAQLLKG
jgi:thymidylate synthase (FAD)